MPVMINQLLLPELREAIESEDMTSLDSFCEILHPSAIADMLQELEDPTVYSHIFKRVQAHNRARLFEYLPDEIQDELAATLPVEDMAKLIEHMSHDERVDLVKRMDDRREAEIMPLVARAEREDIVRLSKYDESTAGSIMTTDYASVPAEINVEEAVRRLRREAPDRETIYYVFVVDADRHLTGFLELKDLIVASPWKKVSDIMREDVIRIPAEMDVEDAAAMLAQYDVLALPVVDADGKLLGIITHDDVIDVVIDAATEDAHLMGAVQPMSAGYLTTPFGETLLKRMPALVILFGAEMIASFVMQGYDKLLHTFEPLMFLVPVIIATGGNSGSQAATLVTRAVALGELDVKDWYKVALRELFQGCILGISIGVLSIVAVNLLSADENVVKVATVLVLALVAVTTCGSLVGSLLPLLFLRLGIDPAYSSGPSVASIIDVVGIGIYLSIAAAILL
jgi:magnesium transporter